MISFSQQNERFRREIGSFCLPKTNVFAFLSLSLDSIYTKSFSLFFGFFALFVFVCVFFFVILWNFTEGTWCVFNNMVPNYRFLCPYSECCFFFCSVCFFFSVCLLVTLSPFCFWFRYYFSLICSYFFFFFAFVFICFNVVQLFLFVLIEIYNILFIFFISSNYKISIKCTQRCRSRSRLFFKIFQINFVDKMRKIKPKMIGKSTLKAQHIHTKPVFRSITVSFNIILRYVSCFLFCFILSDTIYIFFYRLQHFGFLVSCFTLTIFGLYILSLFSFFFFLLSISFSFVVYFSTQNNLIVVSIQWENIRIAKQSFAFFLSMSLFFFCL